MNYFINILNPIPDLFGIIEQAQSRIIQCRSIIQETIRNYETIGIYICTYCSEIIEGSEQGSEHGLEHGSAAAAAAAQEVNNYVSVQDVENHVLDHFYLPAVHMVNEYNVDDDEREDDREQDVLEDQDNPIDNPDISCPLCNRHFTSPVLLGEHFTRFHNDYDALNSLDNKGTTEYTFIGFDKLLENGMLKDTDEILKMCPICCSTYEDSSMKPYVLTCCKAISCDQCLKQHIESKNGKLECMFCRKEH